MPYHEKPLCEICRTPGHLLYRDLPDLTFASPHKGSLFRCDNPACRTLWANPFPDGPTIATFYASYYTHAGQEADGGQTGPRPVPPRPAGLRGMAKAVLRRLSGGSRRFASDLRYLQDLPPGRLLDIGCGNGGFLTEAATQGWTVFGQEFDPVAAEVARAASGAEVAVGDLLDIGYAAGSFDAVTLSNVLEHLPNPREVLQEVRRILAPGGTLVSLSPNPDSYLHRKYGAHWRGLEVPRHLFLLPPAALGRLAEETGFRHIEHFSALGIFAVMEQASAEIRQADLPQAPALPVTPGYRRAALQAGALLGREQGEWSVLIART